MTRRHSIVGLLLLLLVTATIYAPSRSIGWVYEDVNWSRTLSTQSGWPVLVAPSRALMIATLAWTGDDVAHAHLVNVALHLLVGLCVYALGRRLLTGTIAPLVASMVYLLHPLSSQAVLYLSGRGDLLVTLFVSSAVVLAIHPSVSLWRWALVGCAVIAAGASKEIGLIGIPLLLLTLLIWRPRTPQTTVTCAAVLVGVVGIATSRWPVFRGIWNFQWQDFVASGGGTSLPWTQFVLLQNAAIWDLLTLFVRMRGFTIDHDPLAFSIVWQMTTAALTGVSVLTIGLTWRRHPLVAWTLAWVGVALAPRFLFPTEEFVAEHHLILAMVGLSLGAAATARAAWRSWGIERDFWSTLRGRERSLDLMRDGGIHIHG